MANSCEVGDPQDRSTGKTTTEVVDTETKAKLD
jgi:hypothetical protein